MKPRTAMGLLMMAGALAFYGAGCLIVASALDAEQREARVRAATDDQCRRIVSQLPNATLSAVGADFLVTVRGISDPRKAMTDASLASAVCPTRRLVEVCVGDSCIPQSDAAAPKQVAMTFRLAGAADGGNEE